MLTVAINSATQRTAVALVDSSRGTTSIGQVAKILGEKSWISNRNEAEKILPAIAAMLHTKKMTWLDIEQVFVIAGPGSFSGLRVGVTIANTIAWATNTKIVSASTPQYEHALQKTGKPFGNAVLKLLKSHPKAKKLIKPVYLKPPHITTPKRSVGTH